MKVLHLIQRYPPAIGGSENWCRSLCEFSASRGIITKVATINLYNIEDFHKVASLENDFFKLGEHDYHNGVHIRRYKLWSFADTRCDVSLAKFLLLKTRFGKTQLGSIFRHSPHSLEMYSKLWGEIKDADIVHLHTIPYFHILAGFVFAKLLKKRIVITPHFHPGHVQYEKKIFYKIMDRCDAVIAVTAFEKNHLAKKGVSEEKIHVTGNSIDITRQTSEPTFALFRKKLYEKHDLDDQTKKIIFIGRKEMHKGIGTLIEAAKILACSQSSKIALFLVGPMMTEFTDRYKDRIELERLKVIDFGHVSEVEKENLLKISDLLALPSEFEAFGIVFLEAWKYNKPVIGSDRGAIPEVIEGAGLCAEYGNAADLAEKIKSVLFNPALAKELGDEGRRKLVKNYTMEAIGKKIFSVYHKLNALPKRVLIVSNLFPPFDRGGAEIVAYSQAKMLKKLGFDVNVFAGMWNERESRFKTIKEKTDFKITRINLHDRDFDRGMINYGKEEVQAEFRKILFGYAPDIVHFHNLYGLSAKLIEECKRSHIPSVITLHDYWFMCFKNTLIADNNTICQKKTSECPHCREDFTERDHCLSKLAERNSLFLQQLEAVDLVISPSEFLLRRFTECGLERSRAVVINNGIDVTRFCRTGKTNSRKIRFGYIGQIIEHKGVDNLLHALSLLDQDEKRKISFSLIGAGEKEFVGYCKGLARELKVSDVVSFVGGVKNSLVPRFLNSMDVLVVPSIWPENSPVTIMEALASGIPVLASNLGGIPELISDGVHGFLHSHNDPKSLAANMKKIIARPEKLMRMRQACLEKAKKYDLKKQVSIIIQHYNQLIGSN